MTKYRKGSEEIVAIQFDPKRMNRKIVTKELSHDPIIIASNGFYIETSEGMKLVNDGDYIIKDENGKFSSCRPDIFENNYELVD